MLLRAIKGADVCGLIGIFIGRMLSHEELNILHDLLTQLLLAHEERGREATGVTLLDRTGHHELMKLPIAASEFVQTNEYQSLLRHWDRGICSVLGHTRKPTKGSQWNPDNNHPLKIGDTIGIHNGTITNDDQLFAQRPSPRMAEVDSEIIFTMLDAIPQAIGNSDFIQAVQDCTRQFTGQFTTMSVNTSRPTKVLVLKYNLPLSFHYSTRLQTLFFASRYLFLRKAFGHQVCTEALDTKTGFIFDLWEKRGKHGVPVQTFSIESANGPN